MSHLRDVILSSEDDNALYIHLLDKVIKYEH